MFVGGLLVLTLLAILAGIPVAFALAGTALLIALVAALSGGFDLILLMSLPSRFFGILQNDLLVAIPLFIFMGKTLEQTGMAQRLLTSLGSRLGERVGGVGLSVIMVGTILAASTGIVGATIVAMGMMSLPAMQAQGYPDSRACGLICASGSLGQIIPPSIVLIMLSDVLHAAYYEAQQEQGVFAPVPISVADLFAASLLPGLLLAGLYSLWHMATIQRQDMPSKPVGGAKVHAPRSPSDAFRDIVPALLLVCLVLGSILFGFATSSEAAGLGASGAMIIAFVQKTLSFAGLRQICRDTAAMTASIFLILLGASMFSLVFRGLGGDAMIMDSLQHLPGEGAMVLIASLFVMFVIGFFLDFVEILYVVVPIIGPAVLMTGVDPLWFGVLIALIVQTSFLTPPFGFALFYLRGVIPDSISTATIYRGVVPFIFLQIVAIVLVMVFPGIATWLPAILAG